MKKQLRSNRIRLRLILIIAIALLVGLALGTDPLNRWTEQWPLLGLIWILVFWGILTAIVISLLGGLDLWRQTRNLRGLEPELTPEQIRAASELQWQQGHLAVWADHLVSFRWPSGVDLTTVRALNVYFNQDTSPLGMLIIRRPGHLPDAIQLVNESRSPDFQAELDSFLARIVQRYPGITLGPERIRLADQSEWKDLRFVTSLPLLMVIMILSSVLPSAKEIPLLSLAMTLPAVLFWYRRFRLFRAIGRNGQFILEMSLFLGSLMLNGALQFMEPERHFGWVIAPVMMVIFARNVWLKYVLLPPRDNGKR